MSGFGVVAWGLALAGVTLAGLSLLYMLAAHGLLANAGDDSPQQLSGRAVVLVWLGAALCAGALVLVATLP